jgi:hypothetical protein
VRVSIYLFVCPSIYLSISIYSRSQYAKLVSNQHPYRIAYEHVSRMYHLPHHHGEHAGKRPKNPPIGKCVLCFLVVLDSFFSSFENPNWRWLLLPFHPLIYSTFSGVCWTLCQSSSIALRFDWPMQACSSSYLWSLPFGAASRSTSFLSSLSFALSPSIPLSVSRLTVCPGVPARHHGIAHR